MFVLLGTAWLALGASLALAVLLFALLRRRLGWTEVGVTDLADTARPFHDELALEAIRARSYVLSDGSVVGAWELQGLATEMMPAEAIEAQFVLLRDALNTLSPLTMDGLFEMRRTEDVSETVRRFEGASDPATPARELMKRRWRQQLDDIIKAGGFLDTRLILYLRYAPPRRKAGLWSRITDVLVAPFVGPTVTEAPATDAAREDAARAMLEREAAACIELLGVSAFAPRRLSSPELFYAAAARLWDASTMAASSVAPRLPHVTVGGEVSSEFHQALTARFPGGVDYQPTSLRAQIADVPIEPGPDRLVVGKRLVAVLTMRVAPAVAEERLLERLRATLDFPATYSVRFTPRAKQAVVDQLRREAQWKEIAARQKGAFELAPNKDNQRAAQESDARESAFVDPSVVPFAVAVTITVEAPDELTLDTRIRAVSQFFVGANDMRVAQETVSAKRHWLNTMPFTLPRRANSTLLSSAELACLFPLFSPWRGSANPVRVFRTSTGEPFGWDPYDTKMGSRNYYVVGGTGTGKGYAGQTLLYAPALIKGGIDLRILDALGTYNHFTQFYDGAFFLLSASSDQSYNFLSLPPVIWQVSEAEREEFLRDHVAICSKTVLLLAPPEEGQQSLALVLVQTIVGTLIREALASRHEPLLHDVYAAMLRFQPDNGSAKARAVVEDLASKLVPFIANPNTGEKGAQWALFDRPTTIDTTVDCLTTDFAPIKDDAPNVVQAALASVIGGLFKRRLLENAALQNGRYTSTLGDEIDGYLKFADFADIFETNFRQGRKMAGQNGVMTQGYQDLASAKNQAFGTMVKALSETIILTRHNDDGNLRDALERDGKGLLYPIITSLQSEPGKYGEVCIAQRQGGQWRVARVIIQPDRLEHWVDTTDPEDRKIRDAYLRKYGPGSRWNYTHREVHALCSELWPNGSLYPALVTGCSMTSFPPDNIAEQVVARFRAEYAACEAAVRARGHVPPVPRAVAAPLTPVVVEPAGSGVVSMAAPGEVVVAPPSSAAPKRRVRSMADLQRGEGGG